MSDKPDPWSVWLRGVSKVLAQRGWPWCPLQPGATRAQLVGVPCFMPDLPVANDPSTYLPPAA